MILDLLPYTKNREGRVSASWEELRYVPFAFSLSMSRGGERVLSTECIFCQTCTTVCPEKIFSATFKADLGGKELLRSRADEKEESTGHHTISAN